MFLSLQNVHNQLAIMICEEILKETGECGHYIRSLPHLKICDDDISLKNDLHNLCSKIIAVSKLSRPKILIVLKIQFNLFFF